MLHDLGLDQDPQSYVEHGMIHLVALAHPNSEIQLWARKRDSELPVVNGGGIQIDLELKAKFRMNLAQEQSRTVEFSDGAVVSVLDDSLYDRIASECEADRKLSFLTVENVGYPDNVDVISELRRRLGPDHANHQAKHYGFENAAALKQQIESYRASHMNRYLKEYAEIKSLASGVNEIPHWNRQYLFSKLKKSATPECQYDVMHVLDSFCKLWRKLGLLISYEPVELWGVPMYLFTVTHPSDSHRGNILLDLFERNGKPPRGMSAKIGQTLAYASLPFKSCGVLCSSQIFRLFHELGHGIHHCMRTTDENEQWLEVPSTLTEFLLNEYSTEIGLSGVVRQPSSAHSIMSDICYSMYCLDLFASNSVFSMGEYYDKYFPGYTLEHNAAHTECNLIQIMNYQSAYYLYILADMEAERFLYRFKADFSVARQELLNFLVASRLPDQVQAQVQAPGGRLYEAGNGIAS